MLTARDRIEGACRALLGMPDHAPLAVGSAEPRPPIANVPNAITIAGYMATLAWLAGAHPGFAVAGIVADEIDGRAARKLGQTSEFGSLLDWGVDLTLTGLTAQRAGLAWTLPVVTPAQVYLRERGQRPAVGSARAAFTAIALLKETRKL